MTKVNVFLLSLLLTVLMIAAIGQSSQPSGRVKGIVADESGARILKAELVFESETFKSKAITDEAGEFAVELPIGDYQISVKANGFCPHQQRLVVESSTRITLDIALKAWASHVGCGNREPGSIFERTNGLGKTDRVTIKYKDGSGWYENSVKVSKDWYEYRRYHEVQVWGSFANLNVYADKIMLHRFSYRLKAIGRVVIDKDGQRTEGKYAEFDFSKQEPKIQIK
jgi:Carboxypeptidase regulatory-like domain